MLVGIALMAVGLVACIRYSRKNRSTSMIGHYPAWTLYGVAACALGLAWINVPPGKDTPLDCIVKLGLPSVPVIGYLIFLRFLTRNRQRNQDRIVRQFWRDFPYVNSDN